MKRFVDLRGQIYNDDDLAPEQQEPCFAFYCTVKDCFETFSGSQTWSCYSDFVTDYVHSTDNNVAPLSRYVCLMPDWTEVEHKDGH